MINAGYSGINSAGDTILTRTYGTGSEWNCGYSIDRINENEFIILGFKGDDASNMSLYLLKVNDSGDSIGTRIYGGRYWDETCWFNSVKTTTDDGYVIATHIMDTLDEDVDIQVIKADSAGNVVWVNIFDSETMDNAMGIVQTPDGGFLVIATNYIYQTYYATWLLKFNNDGDTLWTKKYGNYMGTYIIPTVDGCYVITGWNVLSNDVFLMKIYESGTVIWTETYGWDECDVGFSVIQTDDEGYVIAGLRDADPNQILDSEYGNALLLKTDSDGIMQWAKDYGGDNLDCAFDLVTTKDGGYLLAGYTSSYGAGYFDAYLVKTDSLGNTDWVREIPVVAEKIALTVSPNPFNSSCAITLCEHPSGRDNRDRKVSLTVEIFDLRGNVVGWLGAPNAARSLRQAQGTGAPVVELDFDELSRAVETTDNRTLIWRPDESISSGVYLVRATVGEKTMTKRIVYLK